MSATIFLLTFKGCSDGVKTATIYHVQMFLSVSDDFLVTCHAFVVIKIIFFK